MNDPAQNGGLQAKLRAFKDEAEGVTPRLPSGCLSLLFKIARRSRTRTHMKTGCCAVNHGFDVLHSNSNCADDITTTATFLVASCLHAAGTVKSMKRKEHTATVLPESNKKK